MHEVLGLRDQGIDGCACSYALHVGRLLEHLAMKYACLYSIVGFAPYAETEEFANVGILLSAPASGRME